MSALVPIIYAYQLSIEYVGILTKYEWFWLIEILGIYKGSHF